MDKDVLAYVRVVSADQPKEVNRPVLVVINRASAPTTLHIEVAGTVIAGVRQTKTLLGEGSAHVVGKTLDIDVPGLGAWVASVEQD